MKKHISQLLKTKTGKGIFLGFIVLFIAITHLGIGGISLQNVKALSGFNSDPQDAPTFQSSNDTRYPGSFVHFAFATDADAGDTVTFGVSYHNSANEDAQNVRASIIVPGTTGATVTADGKLWADNFNESNGQTTINLSSSQSLTYIPGSAQWYPNGSQTASAFPYGQSGDEVVTSGGVNLGDISSGSGTQGIVTARFVVSTNVVVPPAQQVSTLQVTANGAQGTRTLSSGESFGVEWISSNVTSCDIFMDGQLISGVAENGLLGPIVPSHPYYPSAGGSKTFSVTCIGLSGPISDSVIVTQPLSPQAPSAPVLTGNMGSVCGGVVELSWNSVQNATSYKLFRDGNLIATITGTSYTDSGLTPNTNFIYSVTASNVVADSPSSNNYTVTSSPACSSGTSTLQVTSNGIPVIHNLTEGEIFGVEWISSNVTSCDLFVDNVLVSGVTENGNLAPVGTTSPYYPAQGGYKDFKVTCLGLSGSISDVVRVTRPAAPQILPPPTNLSAVTSAQCGGLINLSWSAVNGAISYNVYRDGVLATTTTSTVFTDSGLVSSQQYSYTVKAVNSSQTSIDSNASLASASPACSSGTSTLQVTSNGIPVIHNLTEGEIFGVEWISSNVTSCDLFVDNVLVSGVTENGNLAPVGTTSPYYPAQGGYKDFKVTCLGLSGSISDVVRVTRPAAPVIVPVPTLTALTGIQCGGTVDISWTNVLGATEYKLFRNGVQIATTTPLVTKFTDTGLSVQTSYSYSIKASIGSVDSLMSAPVSVNSSNTCPINLLPPTISAVTGSQCGGTIFVSWNLVQNASFYKVFRGGVQIATTTNLSFTDTLLTPGQAYAYTVKASSGSVDSIFSNSHGAVASTACVVPPQAPQLVAETGPQCGGSITLTWNIVPGANTYKVLRNGTVIGSNITSNSYVDSGLIPNSTHSYTVIAHNSAGDSVSSNVQTVVASDKCPLPTPTVSLTANPSLIDKGQNSNLVWTSTNTNSCSALWTSATSTSGNKDVSPLSSTSYSITCTNGSSSVTATTTVTVVDKPGDPVATIVASKIVCVNESDLPNWGLGGPDIDANTASTFVTMHPSCHLEQGWQFEWGGESVVDPGRSFVGPAGNNWVTFGTSTDLSGKTSTLVNLSHVGSKIWVREIQKTNYISFTYDQSHQTNEDTVSAEMYCSTDVLNYDNYDFVSNPQNGLTYHCVAWNVEKVSAPQLPIVSLSANPSTIFVGATSTLTWNSSNTTSCSAPWTTATSTSGSFVVSPATTTTYAITCARGNASSTATTIVTVKEKPALPSVSLSADPSTVFPNDPSTLSWNSSNTTSCSAPWTTATSTSGSFVVNPSQTTTYSIVCTNGSLSASTTATVTVVPRGGGGDPITVSLSANPSTIFVGATSTLTWNSSNTTSCSAPWTTATSTSGSFVVSPATTTTYAITCARGNASSTATTIVTVVTLPQCVVPVITSALTVGGTVNTDFSYTLTATSGNGTTTYAISSSNLPAGLSVSGNTIAGTPTQTGTFTVVLTATNSCGTDTKTLVITINPQSTGGGGNSSSGGGSSSGGHRRPVPAVLGVVADCEYLRDYLHIGWDNDPVEMIKLQVFLKELEGFKNLQITGVFDQETFDAVAKFQVKYQPDVLSPWGYAQGEYTGYVYILTKKKVNEIFCARAYPVNASQQEEIDQFRAFLGGLKAQGITISQSSIDENLNVTDAVIPIKSIATSSLGTIGLISGEQGTQNGSEKSDGIISNENLRNAASAIFAGPQGLGEAMKSLVFFILILLVLYGIADAFTRLQNKDDSLSASSVRMRKVFTFIIGLICVIILCFILGFFAIILPLLILLIIIAAILLWVSFKSSEPAAVMIPPYTATDTPIILPGKVVGFSSVKPSSPNSNVTPNVEPIFKNVEPISPNISETPKQ